MIQLSLYSRSGCHLCDAMEDELQPFLDTSDITITRILIDNNEALEKLYGHRVPVLTYNGQVVCEYFLDPDILNQLITAS